MAYYLERAPRRRDGKTDGCLAIYRDGAIGSVGRTRIGIFGSRTAARKILEALESGKITEEHARELGREAAKARSAAFSRVKDILSATDSPSPDP